MAAEHHSRPLRLRIPWRTSRQRKSLDDYFTVNEPCLIPATSLAASQMATILRVLKELGVPVSDDPGKVVGPTTRLILLRICFDSVAWEMSLPNDKLVALQHALQEWDKRRTCSKRNLLSLIGKLAFAAKVVPPGRTFLRRLIDLSTTAHHASYPLSLL